MMWTFLNHDNKSYGHTNPRSMKNMLLPRRPSIKSMKPMLQNNNIFFSHFVCYEIRIGMSTMKIMKIKTSYISNTPS